MPIEIVNISIEQLNALLDEKVNKIITAISLKNKEPSFEWLDLKGLILYLPSKPKQQTIYDWVHKGIIPFYKNRDTKMLSFSKTEIDEWLKQGRRKTRFEKEQISKKYLNINNKNNEK